MKSQTVDARVLDTEKNFSSLLIDKRIAKGVTRLGFKQPTLIQSHAIPLALKGKDVLARAKTGRSSAYSFFISFILAHIFKY